MFSFSFVLCKETMVNHNLALLTRDLTQLGLPSSLFSIGLVSDESSYKYNPDRYTFYQEVLNDISDPDQKIAAKIFRIFARNRRQQEKLEDKINHISSAISYLKSMYTKPSEIGAKRNYSELDTLERDLNSGMLRTPIINKEYEFKTDFNKEGINKETETVLANTTTTPEETPKAPVIGGEMEEVKEMEGMEGGSYFSDKINEINKINNQPLTGKQREAEEEDVIAEYKNNPTFSPDNEKVTFTDRIVFIATTFVFRAIALTLLNSAIQTRYISKFTQAFGYYFIIYSLLFIIWITIVNIPKDNHLVGLLFYYVNTRYDSSIWYSRIGVHLVLQLLILPMPILLTPKYSSQSETDTFEKREHLYNTLTFFTFIIWFITALVALRA